ncbi:hypothetical protein FXO37_15493 [Capsicum annuum]|nr:hypothetical protein FXO37_15493 [Capsicum annuum]
MESLANIMNDMSLSTFSPTTQSCIDASRTSFCLLSGELPSTPTLTSPHLTLEKIERVNTLEILRASNKELDKFLSQLRVPRSEVLNMVDPLTLELTESVQKIVTILISLGLTELALRANIVNSMREDTPKVTLIPFSRKRKASLLDLTSNPNGKDKVKVP